MGHKSILTFALGGECSSPPPSKLFEEVWFGCFHRLCLVVPCTVRTEEKAKVVAAVWGTELIKFLAALVFLH